MVQQRYFYQFYTNFEIWDLHNLFLKRYLKGTKNTLRINFLAKFVRESISDVVFALVASFVSRSRWMSPGEKNVCDSSIRGNARRTAMLFIYCRLTYRINWNSFHVVYVYFKRKNRVDSSRMSSDSKRFCTTADSLANKSPCKSTCHIVLFFLASPSDKRKKYVYTHRIAWRLRRKLVGLLVHWVRPRF